MMGQQETMWATGNTLRRTILALLVALMMVGMLLVMAAPAMAASPCGGHGWHPNPQTGGCQFKNFRS